MQGHCKFFNSAPAAQYGFIALEDADMIYAEYFYHRDNVIGPLPCKGDQVSFLLGDDRHGRGGLVAIEVKVNGYPEGDKSV